MTAAPSKSIDQAAAIDQGLSVLVTMLRFQGIGASGEQLCHQFGHVPIGVPEMLRCAKSLGLKARCYKTNWTRLGKTPLPGIAVLRDGGFLFVAKVGDDKVIVQSPLLPRPTLMARAE